MNRLVSRAVSAIAILSATAGCAVPLTTGVEPDLVELVTVPGGIAASSPRHGPFGQDGGRAFGFNHDEVGETNAATQIGSRSGSSAGPAITEATPRVQYWGDLDAARERLTAALPVPDQPPRLDLRPSPSYFRVIAGDCRGYHNVVSLLADTTQAGLRRGDSQTDATLRRTGGEWRLQVLMPRPSRHSATTGYSLLAGKP